MVTDDCGKPRGLSLEDEPWLRDALIVQLEIEGGTSASGTTVCEFMEAFLAHKERSGTIEPSTVRSYRGEAKQVCRYRLRGGSAVHARRKPEHR